MSLFTEMRVGENIDASLAGLDVPFPWDEALRAESPITDATSHLRPYWYHTKSRWVLYDCTPFHLIPLDRPWGGPVLGQEWLDAFTGPPPRDARWKDLPCSDVQHEMYRRYRVHAAPFWVLQGDGGGHPVRFSPREQNILIAAELPTAPPPIGAYPGCPFDMRTIQQLRRRNRLLQYGGSLKALRDSGSAEAADRMVREQEKQIRLTECAYVEQLIQGLMDQANALMRNRSEVQEETRIIAAPGSAAKAADAYAEYKETGNFPLQRVAGGI